LDGERCNAMRARWLNLLWGLILIGAGSLFLAQNLGLIPEIAPSVWVWVFAILSLLFFASYFVNGLDQWPWLVPACVFAGLALTILLAYNGASGTLIALPVLGGVALPFLAAFIIDPRRNWWALIPAWVMVCIIAVVYLSERLPGSVVAAFLFFAIGLPFLVVFLVNRRNWWALIPAFVLGAVGVVVLLGSHASGPVIGAFVMFAVALPFLVAYVWSVNNWWALIPGGILTSVGLVVLFSEGAAELSSARSVFLDGLLYAGIAVTFGILWLRRGSQPTGWAIYPAVLFALAAVAVWVFKVGLDTYWPVLLILGGVLILYFSLRPRRAHDVQSSDPE
jgi:hypothetical protein